MPDLINLYERTSMVRAWLTLAKIHRAVFDRLKMDYSLSSRRKYVNLSNSSDKITGALWEKRKTAITP